MIYDLKKKKNFDVVLIHAMRIVNDSHLTVEWTRDAWKVVTETQTIDGVCDVELVECERYQVHQIEQS